MANKPFKYLKTSPTGDSYTPVDETARNRIGDLSQLTTEHKSNLVEAINEAAQSGGGGSSELPSGGSKGQVLTKLSSTDGDADWEYPIVVLYASGSDTSNLSVSWSTNYSTFDLFSHQELMEAKYDGRFLKILEAYISAEEGSEVNTYNFIFGAVVDIDYANNTGTLGMLHVTTTNGSAHSGSATYVETTIGSISIEGYTSNPEMDGIASPGNSDKFAKGNHVHPSDTSKLNKPTGGTVGQVMKRDADGNGQWEDESVATAQQVQDAVDDYLGEHPALTGMFTNAAKDALISLLEKVVYVDGNGQQYLNELITNLAATVTSISAVFTQGSAVIYDTDSLETLEQYLVVTASYSDGTSGVVSGYTLSGTLTVGTSTITVSYGGHTDTFTVTVTSAPLWTFTDHLAIVKGSSGVPNGKCYLSSTAARAAGTAPIANNNYVFTVTDSTKYNLAAYDITSNTPESYASAADGKMYPAGTKSISWKTTDSVSSAYVWLALKKMDGTAFTSAELSNGASAVFTCTENP